MFTGGRALAKHKYLVNSEQSFGKFIKSAREDFDKFKWCNWVMTDGEKRSLDSNALLSVWALELGCALAGLQTKGLDQYVREGIIAGVKRRLKMEFYRETAHSWLIYDVVDPLTQAKKKDFITSSTYTRPQMFEFLSWIEAYAMTNHGVLLESKGEYKHRKKEAIK